MQSNGCGGDHGTANHGARSHCECAWRLFAKSGLTFSIDGDGDIYLSDQILGFPLWLTIDRVNKVIVLFSYTEYKSVEEALDALESAQRIRLGPMTPQFFLQDASLYAHYVLSYQDGLILTHIYNAACRFAEYFCSTNGSEARSVHYSQVLH